MAVKKGERMEIQFERLDDPAVEAALGPNLPNPAVSTRLPFPKGKGQEDVYGRIERARRMTPSQRKKAERDAARSKVTYDIPAELIKRVEVMAREVYRCPPSHLAALLIQEGLRAIGEGRLNVYDHRVPSRVPRFDFFLEIELGEIE